MADTVPMPEDHALTYSYDSGISNMEVIDMSKKKARDYKANKDAQKRGLARAESMTPEERSESARHAAAQRWAGKTSLPKETHSGILNIAGVELPCAVLETGMRVFSQTGMFSSLGAGRPSGKPADDRGEQLPGFLGSKAIFPFVPETLSVAVRTPIVYIPKHAGRTAYGYEVTLLPAVCDVLLEARKQGGLNSQQVHIADQAESLVRAFAKVGIIALVDEATGYQADRATDELQKILEKYISPELLAWTRKFPPEFFKQIYRIHGWKYQPGNTRGPSYVGKLIKKYVYGKLPPGVLGELETRNPVVDGRRKFKHFQWLSQDTGHPHLDGQILKVTTLLQISDNPKDFERHFKRAFPTPGQQTELSLPGKDD